ncbi:MAG: hypothetical protein A2879_03570 [Omnitrophica WOR_2 bacterium RIFCSPHIGHO2_01_FULL_49_10]|nr:MAG: hypothetical protein A2879_03570 [Omnitrophica WOR_2 bacterium RIFCSPHIGHO2_01_FULL_49_10]OGX33750.1 MAG: hypothetical protein A3I43_03140 [Omnitrophica WOR_2 bacterium RIFCSPLOWO2_02_FULL_50_19]
MTCIGKGQFYYEKRGRKDGYDLDDWLRAEQMVKFEYFKYLKEIATFIAAIVTIFGLGWTIYQGMKTNERTDLNTELANRPFVSIEEPYWIVSEGGVAEGKMFEAGISIKNYGSKPAEKVKDRNFRAIIFDIKNIEIKDKIGNDKNILDERKRLTLELIRLLVGFFEKNPDANNENISTYLSQLSPDCLELKDKAVLLHKGALLFNELEVSQDLNDYKKGEGYLIFPTQPLWWSIKTDMSDAYLEGIIEGKYLLIVYWGIEYKGFRKDKEYSTFYLGYYDAMMNVPKFELQKFQSWSTDETVKN